MAQHTVTAFDTELDAINRQLIAMGAKVKEQVEAAVALQSAPDEAAARRIVEADRQVDEMQLRIEEKVIETIARRQPLAIDLRSLISTLKIASDLERVGDLAKSNAKRTQSMMGQSGSQSAPAGNIDILGRLVVAALERTLTAFATRDDKLAQQVWLADKEIDDVHAALFRELLTYMMEDPRNIGRCTHLLFCARNLERIGDHATNVVEQVHFIVTGRTMPIDRPKGEGANSA